MPNTRVSANYCYSWLAYRHRPGAHRGWSAWKPPAIQPFKRAKRRKLPFCRRVGRLVDRSIMSSPLVEARETQLKEERATYTQGCSQNEVYRANQGGGGAGVAKRGRGTRWVVSKREVTFLFLFSAAFFRIRLGNTNGHHLEIVPPSSTMSPPRMGWIGWYPWSVLVEVVAVATLPDSTF